MKKLVVYIFMILSIGLSHAQGSDYDTYLKQGEKYYNQKEYTQAKQHFTLMLTMFPQQRTVINAWLVKCNKAISDVSVSRPQIDGRLEAERQREADERRKAEKKAKDLEQQLAEMKRQGERQQEEQILREQTEQQNLTFQTDYSNVKIGYFFYTDGSFSVKLNKGKVCVGIVFSLETTETEKAHGWTHGQIVALEDANYGNPVVWEQGDKYHDLPFPHVNYQWDDSMGWFSARKDKEGYLYTHSESVWNIKKYEAFQVAKQYKGTLPEGKTSGWYLPSIGQWADIITHLGKAEVTHTEPLTSPSVVFDGNTEGLKSLQIQKTRYWSATEESGGAAYLAWFRTNGFLGQIDVSGTINTKCNVRSVAAF